jgi:hypothetical protein
MHLNYPIGANGVIQTTPTCFLTAFGEIFLKKYSKKSLNLKKYSYHFFKVHVKNLAKNAIFKQIEIHLQVLFYCLKVNIIVFNECFGLFFIHWINCKLIHMFP